MNLKNKIILYLCAGFLSLIALLIITYIFTIFDKGVLFFSAFFIAIISGLIGGIAFSYKEKDFFTNIIVTVSFILFGILFIYLGPISQTRSLSYFIYFYSVENGKISKKIYNDNYFRPYVQRRFTEGEYLGFLKCDKEKCTPTTKAKLAYYTLFPLYKISHGIPYYNEFKNSVKQIK